MHPRFPSRHRNSHGRKRFAQWCLRRFRTQGCSLGVSRRFLLISQCIQFLRAYGQTCRVLFHVKRVVSAFDPARSYPHLLWMIVDNRWITHPHTNLRNRLFFNGFADFHNLLICKTQFIYCLCNINAISRKIFFK